MIPIRDRVEFGSPAWLSIAQGVLHEQAAGGALPAGSSVSVSECYDSAPRHLELPGDRASWTIRIADGEAVISAGATADADVRITGDYHAALVLAQTYYADAAARDRAVRESVHRAGADALVTAGSVGDRAVDGLLARFHNEMARRTLDNPDLEERLRAQGIEKNARELDEFGYTIVENAVSHAFADEVRSAIIERVIGPGTDGHHVWWDGEADPEVLNGQASRLLVRGRVFEEAALHPWMLSLAEHLCGKLFNFTESLGVIRSTGGSMMVHDDAALIREPFPEYALMGTSIWALEEWDMAAGPTLVVPGSHHKRAHVPDNYAGDHSDFNLTALEMPKGSIALWNAATWHAAQVRTAPGIRVTLHNVFSRVFVRGFDRYHEIEPTLLDNNPPIMTTMCGFDTVYDNNTDEGPFVDGLILNQPHFQS